MATCAGGGYAPPREPRATPPTERTPMRGGAARTVAVVHGAEHLTRVAEERVRQYPAVLVDLRDRAREACVRWSWSWASGSQCGRARARSAAPAGFIPWFEANPTASIGNGEVPAWSFVSRARYDRRRAWLALDGPSPPPLPWMSLSPCAPCARCSPPGQHAPIRQHSSGRLCLRAALVGLARDEAPRPRASRLAPIRRELSGARRGAARNEHT